MVKGREQKRTSKGRGKGQGEKEREGLMRHGGRLIPGAEGDGRL